MQSETVEEAIYVQQAELLVDLLSTFKPFFIKGISEYALIELLKKAPYQFFDEDALREPLILFKTHFVLFHALYQLKRDWRERNEGELDIHALNISLKPIDKSDAEQNDGAKLRGKVITEPDKLAEYYLDWSNFEKTDRDSVETLLNGFWQRMAGLRTANYQQSDIDNAHDLLGVNEADGVSRMSLKRAYKKTLQRVHPDKGGNGQQAQKVIQAYQMLCAYYSLNSAK